MEEHERKGRRRFGLAIGGLAVVLLGGSVLAGQHRQSNAAARTALSGPAVAPAAIPAKPKNWQALERRRARMAEVAAAAAIQ